MAASTHFPILDLPDLVLVEVFQNFSTEEILTTLAYVCKRFHETSRTPGVVRKLKLTSKRISAIASIPDLLSNYPWVKCIQLKTEYHLDCKEIFEAIEENCPNLKSMEFDVGYESGVGVNTTWPWIQDLPLDEKGFINSRVTSIASFDSEFPALMSILIFHWC